MDTSCKQETQTSGTCPQLLDNNKITEILSSIGIKQATILAITVSLAFYQITTEHTDGNN